LPAQGRAIDRTRGQTSVRFQCALRR
jgi:hypothetical protein